MHSNGRNGWHNGNTTFGVHGDPAGRLWMPSKSLWELLRKSMQLHNYVGMHTNRCAAALKSANYFKRFRIEILNKKRTL